MISDPGTQSSGTPGHRDSHLRLRAPGHRDSIHSRCAALMDTADSLSLQTRTTLSRASRKPNFSPATEMAPSLLPRDQINLSRAGNNSRSEQQHSNFITALLVVGVLNARLLAGHAHHPRRTLCQATRLIYPGSSRAHVNQTEGRDYALKVHAPRHAIFLTPVQRGRGFVRHGHASSTRNVFSNI